MLFADDGKIDTWVGVVGAVVIFLTGGGLYKLLELLAGRRDKRARDEQAARGQERRERLEDEERETTRLEHYIVRVEAELKESRKEIHDLRNDLVRVQVREGRLITHVRHLEQQMSQQEIPFVPWVNGGDVVPHGPEATP